jgi:ribose transport system ATP-binding protein
VAENVLMGVEPRRRGLWDGERARRVTREVLAEFGHGDIDPDARLGRLPIGAQQVVEICRAIATRARVVLMDEPTSSLPRGDTERLFALIRRLSASGVAVVYISHFLEETRAVASAYTVLRDGRSVGSGLARSRHQRGADRPHGRPHRERSLPEAQPARSLRAGAGGRGPRSTGPAPGLLQPRAGRGARDLRPDGLRPHRDGAALFGLARPAGGQVRVHGRERPLAAAAADRLADGLGYLSEDRRAKAWPCRSRSPTTSR